jgi:rSAM/selenodomain-associated transferase 1
MNPIRRNSSTPSPATLILFCKRPAPGVGKQRIAAEIGVGATCALAERLLATAVEDAESWPGPVILAPAEAADARWAESLLSRSCAVMPQSEGNLGRRINAIDVQARKAGHSDLIFIGSDAPMLDADYFAKAQAALASHDVVLGPADDGGVTLMGAKQPWPDIEALPWSSDQLGAKLELSCVKLGLSVYSLETRYDIDFASDLQRLSADIALDTRPARRKLCRWLETTAPDSA